MLSWQKIEHKVKREREREERGTTPMRNEGAATKTGFWKERNKHWGC